MEGRNLKVVGGISKGSRCRRGDRGYKGSKIFVKTLKILNVELKKGNSPFLVLIHLKEDRLHSRRDLRVPQAED